MMCEMAEVTSWLGSARPRLALAGGFKVPVPNSYGEEMR
jgi:hypothetical protein